MQDSKLYVTTFLVRDDSLNDFYNSKLYKYLIKEGFSKYKHGLFTMGCPWVFINIHSKVFFPGKPGVAWSHYVVGEHAVTSEEFCTMYEIYKKYYGLSKLQMSPSLEKYEEIIFVSGQTEVTIRIERKRKTVAENPDYFYTIKCHYIFGGKSNKLKFTESLELNDLEETAHGLVDLLDENMYDDQYCFSWGNFDICMAKNSGHADLMVTIDNPEENEKHSYNYLRIELSACQTSTLMDYLFYCINHIKVDL